MLFLPYEARTTSTFSVLLAFSQDLKAQCIQTTPTQRTLMVLPGRGQVDGPILVLFRVVGQEM